ncbi:MAG: transglycosylase SLT domain-containing protein [Methylobacter sp.]
MPFIDLAPPLQERVVCSITAAIKYEIPANIVLAVAEKEAGKPGQWVRNANGTHDIGAMQFNTSYLSDLKRYGITANDVAASGCYSFDLAAWRLRMHIRNDQGDLWTKAANYHSQTRKHNIVYRADLMRKAAKWADWLEARFVTIDVTKNHAKTSMLSHPAPSPTELLAKMPEVRSTNLSTYVSRQISFNTNDPKGMQYIHHK